MEEPSTSQRLFLLLTQRVTETMANRDRVMPQRVLLRWSLSSVAPYDAELSQKPRSIIGMVPRRTMLRRTSGQYTRLFLKIRVLATKKSPPNSFFCRFVSRGFVSRRSRCNDVYPENV